MDPIKEAFLKAKQDITSLKEEISLLREEISFLKDQILQNQQLDSQTDTHTVQQTGNPAYQQSDYTQNQPIQHEIPAQKLNEPVNLPLEALKTSNLMFSTGNRGVPADRQTDQQTVNRQTDTSIPTGNGPTDRFQMVSELLNSLDEIKREVRIKFKKLTKQEMLVFSTIYQFEEQGLQVDYSILSKKLSLTESSIRDYIQKMIKKGVPIQKSKENNKKILLSISKELKKIASLSTILQLREL